MGAESGHHLRGLLLPGLELERLPQVVEVDGPIGAEVGVGRLTWGRPGRLPKTEDGQESFVDPPQLFRRDVADVAAEPGRIDRSKLLDKDSREFVVHDDLRAERCRASAPRSRCHEDDRPGKQFIRLDDHAEALTSLLVTTASRKTEFVDVTAAHAGAPSWLQPRASPGGLARRPRGLPPRP